MTYRDTARDACRSVETEAERMAARIEHDAHAFLRLVLGEARHNEVL